MMFASPPAVTTVDARGISLPCSTADWTPPFNEIAWTPPKPHVYEDAMVALWSGKPLPCSAFGVRILATSVFLEIWQAQHGHDSWLPDNWKERHYIVVDCLRQCIDVGWGTSREEGSRTSIQCSDPLAWNAMHVLYGCAARLGTDTTYVEEGLCYSTAQAVRKGIRLMHSEFDASKVDVRAVQAALQGYNEVLSVGIKIMSQTACWERGLEHAFAGLHSAIFLVNWARHVEGKGRGAMTAQEQHLLGRLRTLMEEGDVNIYQESLAASFLRSCIQLMEETWIWGITPLIGEAFRLYTEEILGSRGAIMEVEPILLEDEQKSEYGD
jgi:hypothetical protein